MRPASGSPITIVLYVASLGLLAACGYLIVRAVMLRQDHDNSRSFTCAVGSTTETYIAIGSSDISVVYVSDVSISDTGPMQGRNGVCDVEAACYDYTYDGASFTCNSVAAKPSSVACYTLTDTSNPVCVRPGSDWMGSMIAAIVCGVFSVSFVAIAVALRRVQSTRPVTNQGVVYVETVSPANGGAPMVAVYGQPIRGEPAVVTV